MSRGETPRAREARPALLVATLVHFALAILVWADTGRGSSRAWASLHHCSPEAGLACSCMRSTCTGSQHSFPGSHRKPTLPHRCGPTWHSYIIVGPRPMFSPRQADVGFDGQTQPAADGEMRLADVRHNASIPLRFPPAVADRPGRGVDGPRAGKVLHQRRRPDVRQPDRRNEHDDERNRDQLR